MMLAFYLSIVETEEDRDKVAYIYEHYYSFMAYTAGQVLKNEFDIEDAVHNAMMTLIENLDLIDFSDPRRTKNLCGIVAKNKARDFARSDKQLVSLDDEAIEELEDDSDPMDILLQQDTYDIILRAIRSLSDTYRDVCMLKYINELKEREIALILGLPPKTVNVRIFRGRQLLKDALRKEKVHA